MYHGWLGGRAVPGATLRPPEKENLKRASKESITIIKPRENKGENEFRWLQKKDTVGLNRSVWSPCNQVDRVCSPVPSVQAGCQKWHQGYELHWKTECRSDPHVVKKEDQFQEQSLSEESLFCPHLTEIYSELPWLSHLKCRIRWSMREWMQIVFYLPVLNTKRDSSPQLSPKCASDGKR